jgi:pyrroloquinoline quinone biosynthesis protein D
VNAEPLPGSARPRLARKARLKLDPIEKKHVLLAPERGLVLSASASAIALRCDGERSLDMIADELATETHADLAVVKEDVARFVAEMVKRGLLEIA